MTRYPFWQFIFGNLHVKSYLPMICESKRSSALRNVQLTALHRSMKSTRWEIEEEKDECRLFVHTRLSKVDAIIEVSAKKCEVAGLLCIFAKKVAKFTVKDRRQHVPVLKNGICVKSTEIALRLLCHCLLVRLACYQRKKMNAGGTKFVYKTADSVQLGGCLEGNVTSFLIRKHGLHANGLR